MDEIDNLTLHYAMLEYLYDHHKLSTSCFSHAWEDFIRENEEYSHMTATELKTIFWTEIAQNLEQHPEKYFLLTDKQLEYFDPDEFPLEHNNELLQSVLEHNEPKAGVDFTFYRSTSAYGSVNDQSIRQQNPDEMMETIKKAFANPTLYNSVFDDELTEINEEDTRINVIAQKPMMEVDMGEGPLEIFKEILLTLNDIETGHTELTDDEVFERLAAEDFDMNIGDLPKGLQYYVKRLGDTLLYKEPEKLPLPRMTTSTPLVNVGNPPPFRHTRSMSTISEVSKERRLLVQNLNANVRQSPKRTRYNRNALFQSNSETSISSKK